MYSKQFFVVSIGLLKLQFLVVTSVGLITLQELLYVPLTLIIPLLKYVSLFKLFALSSAKAVVDIDITINAVVNKNFFILVTLLLLFSAPKLIIV